MDLQGGLSFFKEKMFLYRRLIRLASVVLLCHVFLGSADFAEGAAALRIAGNMPNGTVGALYTGTYTAMNGTPPYFWTLTAGPLPPGLIYTAGPTTFVISGTPTAAGNYPITVTLTDSSTPTQQTDSKSETLRIAASSCAFTGSTTGAISFGAIDPSLSPGPVLGAVTLQIPFNCAVGVAYTVTANPASGWSMVSGANTIAYTLDYTMSGTGLGATPINLLTTNSRINQADYQNAPVGAYMTAQPVSFTLAWAGGALVASLPAGSVNGTVLSKCVVSQAPGMLTFAIDPSVAGSASATITPDMQIKCTRNSSVTVTALSSCGGLSSTYPVCGGSLIPYTFNYLPNVTGQGFGTGISLNIGGSATSANYENAPVGSYGDLQTLTITY